MRTKDHGIPSDHLRPSIVYRKPKDDVIRSALQEGARRLKAEGKPLVRATDDKYGMKD